MPRTLYDAVPSANSVRVRILLHEKSLDYQRMTLDLSKKEQKRPEFLRLNPYGKVPVLDDNGNILFESLIINEYLEEQYPAPSFMPKDPYLRGRIRLLTDYGMRYINEPFTAWRLQMRGKLEERDPKTVGAAGNAVLDRLRYLEDALGEQLYWAGEISLADIALAPRFLIMDEFGLFPTPSLPRLSAWLERMKARPALKLLGQ